MKIFLTGFMGSGKSFIGKKLADSLQFDFVDIDVAIELSAGSSIAEIFAQQGEATFRKLERDELRKTENLHNAVIATGGGAPCFHDNMNWMNDHGLTLFLSVPVVVLVQRLKTETKQRPLLNGRSDNDLFDYIDKKLNERMGFYNQAHFVCHANDTPDNLVASIDKYFSRFLKNH
ncbi:MAG: shikimate kinase [Bacteroidota bacterium]